MYSVLQDDSYIRKKKKISLNLCCFIQQEYPVFPFLGGSTAKHPQTQHPHGFSQTAGVPAQTCPTSFPQVSCFDLQPKLQESVLFTATFLGAWII